MESKVKNEEKRRSSPRQKQKDKCGEKPGRKPKKTPDEMSIERQVGEHVRKIRESKGMSAEDCTKLNDTLEPAHIYKVEHGRVSPELGTLEKISKSLGVEVWQLLQFESPPPVHYTPEIEKTILYMNQLSKSQQETILKIVKLTHELLDRSNSKNVPGDGPEK